MGVGFSIHEANYPPLGGRNGSPNLRLATDLWFMCRMSRNPHDRGEHRGGETAVTTLMSRCAIE